MPWHGHSFFAAPLPERCCYPAAPGAGGTYATFMPTPTPTPTPTPAPTPSPTPATVTYAPMHIFSGLASNTNFIALGYNARTTPPLNSPYTGTFAITYDAASN